MKQESCIVNSGQDTAHDKNHHSRFIILDSSFSILDSMNLVIVESPTKAKTIAGFLKKGFMVTSSFGHIRDLPANSIGVDTEHDFTPTYVIPTKAKKNVTELKKLAKRAETVWFATDDDREGEAISWHLLSALDIPELKTKRIVFHEITKQAIEHALETPRSININLVNAQQARRIIDRLVGYELSPFLWKKVARGLSAGRVQSVLVRLLVEREREILSFKPEEYWTIEGLFENDSARFEAKLHQWKGKTLEKFDIPNEARAAELHKELEQDSYRIVSTTDKKTRRSSPPPFTTSTLQQEANKRLGFSSKQTMYLAQELYEGINIGGETVGLITYMRTDSVNLSEQFITGCAAYLETAHGQMYVNKKTYSTKSKLAQEAHEAIRPTDVTKTPESLKNHLSQTQWKIYDLIWRRAVASQMPDAELNSRSIDIEGQTTKGVFRATGITVVFDGFLKLYPESLNETTLPTLSKGTIVNAPSITTVQHFTEPPARYTEASIIKKMEELGIGRPSTYAPTIGTVLERNYATKEGRSIKPTELGMMVNDLLVEHFPNIVDYQFTADMEDELDAVASGVQQWIPVVKAFYKPFKENLKKKKQELSKKNITEEATEEMCDLCGKPMVIKMGRFGKFLACSGFPDCKNTKPIKRDEQTGAIDLKETNAQKTEPVFVDETCEKCGEPMMRRTSRFGEFLSCSTYPTCTFIKSIPKTTGATCPECKNGEIVERRSRRGKLFYSCTRYPDCTFALWQKPTGEKCPTCNSLLIFAAKGKIKCSNNKCTFETTQGQD